VAVASVDADREVAGDGHSVEPARQVVVVVDRVVLGDPVVEQDQLVRRPAMLQHVLGPRHVGLQQPQQVARLAARQSRDALCEPADEQPALAGERVHPYDGVRRLVADRAEHLAPLALAGIDRLFGNRVVVVVGVDGEQRVGQGA
jgi:hypothetical protein